MSQPNWLNIGTRSGIGSGTSSMTPLSANTNRDARSCVVTATTNGGETSTCTVSQTGVGESVSFNAPNARRICDNGEKSLTFTGTSNAKRLTASVPATLAGVTITSIQISTDGGVTWTNVTSGTDITGDPGNTGTYMFRIVYDTTSISGSNTVTHQFTISGTSDTDSITTRLPYTLFDDDGETVAYVSGNEFVIYGSSNSAKLHFAGDFSAVSHTLHYSTDNGSTWTAFTDNTAISGDPGSSGTPYKFKVVFDMTTAIESRIWTLDVYDNRNGKRSTVYISC